MKTLYFVRHGESESNVGERFTDDETAPLTERGKRQAEALAERCMKLPIEAIIASPLQRTRETVEAISKRVSAPVEFSREFVERPIPASLHGLVRTDPEARRIRNEWEKGIFVDGNEFSEVKERAARALSLLEQRPESNMLIVTHGYFMRTILAYVLFGPSFTSSELGHIVKAIPNTEKSHISVFRYYEDGRDSPWKLWVWNDHAHLG
jgi:ribonuclease H / adenosylcobalamin/alpha-ribazole phosphatase